MTDRVRVIEHGIVLQDFSNVHTTEEGLALIAQAKTFMETQPKGEVLVLTDATGSIFNQQISDAMKDLAQHHKQWVRASALVGLTPLMRLAFRAVVSSLNRNIKALESRTAAVAYLLARRASASGPSKAVDASRQKP